MTEKPPLWADILLTLWVVAVAVFYFGGYFLPAQIGAYIQDGSASAGTLAWNYLHRGDADKDNTRKDKTNPRS